MIKVGLTGGIGSGKTTVAKAFQSLGIPVFYADTESKKLLHSNAQLKQQLQTLLGKKLYQNNTLNKAYFADKIFTNKALLAEVNAIIHPAVATAFAEWCTHQSAPYVLEEAAILFETDAYKKFDKTILVTAPQAMRIKRVMARDNTSETAVLARMKNQWADEKKIPLADYVINNTDAANLNTQIRRIHENILSTTN